MSTVSSPPIPAGNANDVIAGALKEMLDAGLRLHQQGDLQQAAQIYGQILKIDPRNADSLHLLGMVASQAGMVELAVDLIRRAIAIHGNAAAFHSNLGSILQSLGRLDEAASEYMFALQLNPQLAETHLNLGLVLEARKQFSEALSEYKLALELKPDFAEAHSNLGNVLQAQGDLDSARQHYLLALQLKPAFAEAHYNLGNVYLAQEDLDQAADSYREALLCKPNLAEAHCNLGNVLQQFNEMDEAIAHYEVALELRPNYAEAHYNLANALSFSGKLQEAVAHYGLSLQFDPNCAKARNNLGNVFRTLKQPADAVAQYLQIPGHDPEFTDAYNNLGLAYLSLGRHEEAIAAIQETLALKPLKAEAHCNLGAVYHAQNRIDAATVSYTRALELKPDLSKATLNLGMVQLVNADFPNGWRNYELRWEDAPLHRRDFQQPQWRGEPLNGARILLHAEQGLGDTLQFLRYVPMVQAAGGSVILEVQDRVVRLAKEIPGVVEVVNWGETLPDFEWQCPLLSLPLAFATTQETIPAAIPYLRVPSTAQARCEEISWPCSGRRIGLLWEGNPTFAGDAYRFRSASLSLFEPLLSVPNTHWFSLQIGEAVSQLTGNQRFARTVTDLSAYVSDMADTAAQISQLDLVITIDSSVAHLAGALGKVVWVLIPYTPDWRWLQNRTDCPWFPTMRLFRQSQPGDWTEVIRRIENALRNTE